MILTEPEPSHERSIVYMDGSGENAFAARLCVVERLFFH